MRRVFVCLKDGPGFKEGDTLVGYDEEGYLRKDGYGSPVSIVSVALGCPEIFKPSAINWTTELVMSLLETWLSSKMNKRDAVRHFMNKHGIVETGGNRM